MSQQRHWDDLRRTADHVEALSKLIGDADTEEIKELKRAKDKGKMLEGEFSSLQKRYNEQEAKLANLQRASITSKHSIAQAQQRSSEWEKRTHELEADLESTRTKLDHSDDMRTQLDAEISSLRMQLEETEGEAASAKVSVTLSLPFHSFLIVFIVK
jgi:chromosome segregation ATPase